MRIKHIIKDIGISLILFILGISSVIAQQHSVPKGVYSSTISDGVDISTGQLQQQFPLLSIKGRGEPIHTLYLPLRNLNNWDVNLIASDYNSQANTTFDHYRIENSEQNIRPYFESDSSRSINRSGYASSGVIKVETKFVNMMFIGAGKSETVKFK
jgi:hypothetical protein